MAIREVWGEGRTGLWTPKGKVDVPASYEFVPAGDGALTRAVKAACGDQDVYLVLKRVSKRYPPKKMGWWAPAEIIQQQKDRLAAMRTPEHKEKLARKKERKQERDIKKFTKQIIKRYPGCPATEAEEIASHACQVGSGRVGRSRTADDPVRAAVVAHIRHQHTEYEEILEAFWGSWMDADLMAEAKQEARESVRPQVDAKLLEWESLPQPVVNWQQAGF